jgi:probable phosphoglycerate mutase
VVEQMSGRWKINHPGMRPLAAEARAVFPPDRVWYEWIPRERNKHADRLHNEAHDTRAGRPSKRTTETQEPLEEPAGEQERPRGWSRDLGTPTTLVLMRHGETDHTREKRFSGRGGADPGLNADGKAQARAVADWLAPLAEEIDAVVTSPLRRTRETAQIIGERLGHEVLEEEGLSEAAFGTWDGLTFREVEQKYPDDLDAWLGSLDVAPGGGESFAEMDRRVRRARDRLIAAYPGKAVLAVSHVTPIKLLVKMALDAPLDAVYRMELAPASVTVISWFDDGTASMRMFNARPMETAFIGR